MKNTFVLSGVSIAIEGQPIAIDKLEVTSEMTVQEIATSGGLVKGLISELKPLISEAMKPVATPATTTAPAAVTTTSTSNHYNNNYKNNNKGNYKNNYNKNDNNNNKYLKLQEGFNALSIPQELKEIGYKVWTFESGTYGAGDRIRVNVDNSKFGVIHINILTTNQGVHIHIYPDNKTYSGISSETLVEFLRWTQMPEAIQAYLLKVATL